MLGLCAVCECPLCAYSEGDTTNIVQSLIFTQTLLAGRDIDLTYSQTLTFSQSLVVNVINSIVQTLTFLQDVVPNDILHFTQSALLSYEYNISIIHDLGFLQRVQVANNYNIAICQCIQFQQFLGWVVELSVTQSLTFTHLLPEICEQFLIFVQTIATNWDDISDCCGVLGIPDKFENQSLAIQQTVVANMVYNIAITQTISFINSVAWRP